MKSLFQKLNEAKDIKKISLEVSESAYPQVLKLLETLQYMGQGGSSRQIVIDDYELSDGKKAEFYFDGDGPDTLKIIEK